MQCSLHNIKQKRIFHDCVVGMRKTCSVLYDLDISRRKTFLSKICMTTMKRKGNVIKIFCGLQFHDVDIQRTCVCAKRVRNTICQQSSKVIQVSSALCINTRPLSAKMAILCDVVQAKQLKHTPYSAGIHTQLSTTQWLPVR